MRTVCGSGLVRLQALLALSMNHPWPSILIGFCQLSLAGLKSVTLGTTVRDNRSKDRDACRLGAP
jgi:hypothetical protein